MTPSCAKIQHHKDDTHFSQKQVEPGLNIPEDTLGLKDDEEAVTNTSTVSVLDLKNLRATPVFELPSRKRNWSNLLFPPPPPPPSLKPNKKEIKSSAPRGPNPNPNLASFPSLPTVKFLIACSMLKQRGPFYHVNDVSVYLGRQRGKDSFLNIRNSDNLDRNYKISPQVSFFNWGLLPQPLCRPK